MQAYTQLRVYCVSSVQKWIGEAAFVKLNAKLVKTVWLNGQDLKFEVNQAEKTIIAALSWKIFWRIVSKMKKIEFTDSISANAFCESYSSTGLQRLCPLCELSPWKAIGKVAKHYPEGKLLRLKQSKNKHEGRSEGYMLTTYSAFGHCNSNVFYRIRNQRLRGRKIVYWQNSSPSL